VITPRFRAALALIALGGAANLLHAAPGPHAAAASAREQLAARGLTPDVERLIEASAQGNLSNVALLIEAGVAAGQVEPLRQVTPLHAAAAQGHEQVVQTLLAHGAPVDAQDWLGVTPLVAAAYGGHAAVMRVLLDAGAQPQHTTREGIGALSAAVTSRQAAAVATLLRAGADPDRADASGVTPRELAARLGLESWLTHRGLARGAARD
jgi:hypothetical protein